MDRAHRAFPAVRRVAFQTRFGARSGAGLARPFEFQCEAADIGRVSRTVPQHDLRRRHQGSFEAFNQSEGGDASRCLWRNAGGWARSAIERLGLWVTLDRLATYRGSRNRESKHHLRHRPGACWLADDLRRHDEAEQNGRHGYRRQGGGPPGAPLQVGPGKPAVPILAGGQIGVDFGRD